MINQIFSSMDKTKLAAKIASILGRIMAIGYISTALYSLLCLATKLFVTPYGEGQFMHINFPFSQTPFLNIDNNAAYIICSFLLPIILYGIFFWLVANLFSVFSKPKLFTILNLLQLKRFYLFNWLVPFPALIISSFFVETESIVWLLATIHGILGVFAWMVAAIFKQGLQLQNEQALFI